VCVKLQEVVGGRRIGRAPRITGEQHLKEVSGAMVACEIHAL